MVFQSIRQLCRYCNKGVPSKIGLPGIELNYGETLVAKMLRPNVQKGRLTVSPRSIYSQYARPFKGAEQMRKNLRRFLAVEQVVPEGVVLWDVDVARLNTYSHV